MRADDERHGELLASGARRHVDGAQIARRIEIDAGFLPAAQHQAAKARIGHAGRRIDHVVDGRHVGRAVGGVLQVHGKLGEVGVRAGQHNFLNRRIGLLQFDEFRRAADASLHLQRDLARLDPEGFRQTIAAGYHVADHFHLFVADVAEPHGLAVAVHGVGKIGEIESLVAGVEFVGALQALDERAKAKAVEIVAAGRHGHSSGLAAGRRRGGTIDRPWPQVNGRRSSGSRGR